MRVYETAHDHCVLPGMHMVARIDGRSFSRLTRGTNAFEAPYDARFRDCMVATLQYLAKDCGFSVIYGYTQSDELSLLFRQSESLFGRKLRKYLSVLAGEASAKFSLELGMLGAFDARISQFPSSEDVVDYFRWRHEDAHRNALNGHCYWLLREQGRSDQEATLALQGVSVSERNELLFRHGRNFNDIPNWQKRGIAVRLREVGIEGQHPKTGALTTSKRREFFVDMELPMKEAYATLVRDIVVAQ